MQKSYATVVSSLQTQKPATHPTAANGRKRGVVYPLDDVLPSNYGMKRTQMKNEHFPVASSAQKLDRSEAQRPSSDEAREKSAQVTSSTSRKSGNTSKKAFKKKADESIAGSNSEAPKSSKSSATKAGTIGCSTTGQTQRPEASTTAEPATENDVDKSPATAMPEPSETARLDKAVSSKNPTPTSASQIVQTPDADPGQVGTPADSKPDKSDDTAVKENLSTQKTVAEAPDASLNTSSSAPNQNHPDVLQGLLDHITSLVLDKVNKETSQRKPSDVDSDTSTNQRTAVDQTTQTDVETRDRRDRLKDKYRERRRVKRQKDRAQQSQEKTQQKKLLEESPPARPTVKLNPMASIFLPPGSSATGILPSSTLPILI